MHYMLYTGVGFGLELIRRYCVDCHNFIGINPRHSQVQLYGIPGKHYSTQDNSFNVSVVDLREFSALTRI